MTKSFDKQEGGTKRRILDAALEALRTEGFAGATSRAIARIGGFNQALIFYHFGSLDLRADPARSRHLPRRPPERSHRCRRPDGRRQPRPARTCTATPSAYGD